MIIDTNFYSAMVVSRESVKDVLAREKRVSVPLPVVAELRSGFVGGVRRVENELAFSRFLAQNTTRVLLPSVETTHLYAEFQQYARSHGRVLSNNDIWIAALAREDGDVLLTYDKDFAVFQKLFGDKLRILS
jgi:tRNA(fMet)-specific endonuclease VapC